MWHQMRVGLSDQRYYTAMKWVTHNHANVQQIHQINFTLQVIILTVVKWNFKEVISYCDDAIVDDDA